MARPDARGALLDAAERLFAERGIPTVSDRQVAEAAGNTNHSAVRYYFGGREGLLLALVERHRAGLSAEHRRLFAESDSMVGDVRALVLPMTTSFAALPSPSWRARFLDQALHDPPTVSLMRDAGERDSAAADIVRSVVARLAHLDPTIVEARARLTTQVVSSTCATIEARAERTGEPARWHEAGSFLCDAIAGMLQAPITEPR
ncbi:TetR/AcrR family transcriptional regulator [Nocardioides campestrisoli]|uniref:TetR/AcrR family transcriptional regulator n=1 Tax=Nocardioides campestrisoli TaxID=2736757 RepID=UPI00163D6CC9|nr:TetR/AcrR family transcriptional regulator [Nocardioides campestrisoli]